MLSLLRKWTNTCLSQLDIVGQLALIKVTSELKTLSLNSAHQCSLSLLCARNQTVLVSHSWILYPT